MFSSYYRLSKSRRILKQGISVYKKKSSQLTQADRSTFADNLEKLDIALVNKNKKEASDVAKKIEAFLKANFPKTFFDHGKELVYALVFAIVFAFLIRQFWFELYEVPTGSMRPTIEELDRLVVSKSTFGINLPFQKGLILYKPEYILRAGSIVFTVAGMDVPDSDTLYFYLFPGKKRYVKRCMGKPGDTVYFYGGHIYGIDKDGAPITELADPKYLKSIGIEKIDHIPFITFDGKLQFASSVSKGIYTSIIMKQMNLDVAKLEAKKDGTIQGLFFNGKQWVEDNPSALKKQHSTPQSYSDLWGFGNYAYARLLTDKEVKSFYGKTFKTNSKSKLYLEMRHTPNLTYPAPEFRRGEMGRSYPMITPMVSILPLEEKHLSAIQNALYTARFIVKNGRAYRYSEGHRPQPLQFDVLFPQVPDGSYEFYYGKGYKVHFGGIRTDLPPNHPLYSKTAENIQKLFNLGIGLNIVFQPMGANQPYNPQRFAYFSHGDLYLMGAPIFFKDDPLLKSYVENELEKQNNSSDAEPYIAFVDHGPPLKEGKLDVNFIRAFGLKIPDDGVLALGDNFAMSADSRDFGFVPTYNLRGAPSFTFWPPSKRLGPFPQPSYPWLTIPNLVVWILVVLVAIGCYIYLKKRNQKRLFKR